MTDPETDRPDGHPTGSRVGHSSDARPVTRGHLSPARESRRRDKLRSRVARRPCKLRSKESGPALCAGRAQTRRQGDATYNISRPGKGGAESKGFGIVTLKLSTGLYD